MVVFPNAKVNLGLNVIERRPDGYHNIESVMVPVDWCDILEIVPSHTGTTTLTVTGNAVDCPSEKNLVMKAYRALSAEVSIPAVEIHLHKIIPDGAGLGGGSADAAYTLKALNALFELGISDERLAAVAATIGADCPFFIYNRPMLVEGIGTRMTPLELDLSHYHILIVKPEASVSTAQAYAGVSPTLPDVSVGSCMARRPEHWQASGLKNDFEKSVFALLPEVGRVKTTLEQSGALYTSMSGSGSAVYAIFDDVNMAERARAMFEGMKTHLGNFI